MIGSAKRKGVNQDQHGIATYVLELRCGVAQTFATVHYYYSTLVPLPVYNEGQWPLA